jgi:hypothetical protein
MATMTTNKKLDAAALCREPTPADPDSGGIPESAWI